MNTITKTLIALSLALGLSACAVAQLGVSATSAVVNTSDQRGRHCGQYRRECGEITPPPPQTDTVPTHMRYPP